MGRRRTGLLDDDHEKRVGAGHRMTEKGFERAQFIKAFVIAFNVYLGFDAEDPTNGALFYLRYDISQSWIARVEYIKNFGNHKYYKFRSDNEKMGI